MDDFPEEVHDAKVETAEEGWEFWAKKNKKTERLETMEFWKEKAKKGKRALNAENVEKAEQAEQEEKTFEETTEFWKEKVKKAEQAEKSIEQELKPEDDTFEEYGFEQADLAEYVADLEAEIKAGKSLSIRNGDKSEWVRFLYFPSFGIVYVSYFSNFLRSSFLKCFKSFL